MKIVLDLFFPKSMNAQKFESQIKVLLIEDDPIAQMIWLQILKGAEPSAVVMWTKSAEEAHRLIGEREALNDPFDFVIADIGLEGDGTGLDVWNAHRQKSMRFLFSSSIDREEFGRLIYRPEERRAPFLVSKPLIAAECTEMVKQLFKGRRGRLASA
jgi:DNA-binding NarL/FixJ family response regulator